MENTENHTLQKRIGTLLQNITAHLGLNWSEQTIQTMAQFILFGMVGLSNALVHYLSYDASLLMFRHWGLFGASDYLAAQTAAFFISTTWCFFWNNRLVFTRQQAQKHAILKGLLKTYITYAFTGLFLNWLLLFLWVQKLGISEFIAPLINILLNTPINFLMSKFWAFK